MLENLAGQVVRRVIKNFLQKYQRRTLDDFVPELRATGSIECTARNGLPWSSPKMLFCVRKCGDS